VVGERKSDHALPCGGCKVAQDRTQTTHASKVLVPLYIMIMFDLLLPHKPGKESEEGYKNQVGSHPIYYEKRFYILNQILLLSKSEKTFLGFWFKPIKGFKSVLRDKYCKTPMLQIPKEKTN
jgi:hypothetical protein